jgi:hypothetical protein
MTLIKPIAYFQKKKVSGGIVLDPDAAAFLTATGITDGTITNAINTLVLDLKADSLWTKMKAIYPFVGGTADTNKYNLVNPQNTDAAYRLTYTIKSGAQITHSSSGFEVKNNQVPNGAGAYAITYIVPNVVVTQSDEHASMYINSNYNQTSGDPVQMGSYTSATRMSLLVARSKDAGNLDKFLGRMNGTIIAGNTSSTTAGYFIVTNNSNTVSLYRNGSSDGSGASTGTLPAVNFYIGGLNISNSDYGSTWTRFATVTYGTGLSATDASNLYDAVQTFNTTLGRQY